MYVTRIRYLEPFESTFLDPKLYTIYILTL